MSYLARSLGLLAISILTLSGVSSSAFVIDSIDSDGTPIVTQSRPLSPARSTVLQKLIHKVACETRIKPELLQAIIENESQWDSLAVSPRGALGLMQLMPKTAKNLGVTNPFDPEQNIRAGGRHLRYLLGLFKNDLGLALAAYHAGHYRIRKQGQIPLSGKTSIYVKHVLDSYYLALRQTETKNEITRNF